MAALHVINEKCPTAQARHIKIQHFAIQEWHDNKDFIMEHLSGILNPSDDLTKPLSWVLHARHARRSMGHHKIGSPSLTSLSAHATHTSVRANEAGEGVGTQSVGDVTTSVTGSVTDRVEEHVVSANARASHEKPLGASPSNDLPQFAESQHCNDLSARRVCAVGICIQ